MKDRHPFRGDVTVHDDIRVLCQFWIDGVASTCDWRSRYAVDCICFAGLACSRSGTTVCICFFPEARNSMFYGINQVCRSSVPALVSSRFLPERIWWSRLYSMLISSMSLCLQRNRWHRWGDHQDRHQSLVMSFIICSVRLGEHNVTRGRPACPSGKYKSYWSVIPHGPTSITSSTFVECVPPQASPRTSSSSPKLSKWAELSSYILISFIDVAISQHCVDVVTILLRLPVLL